MIAFAQCAFQLSSFLQFSIYAIEINNGTESRMSHFAMAGTHIQRCCTSFGHVPIRVCYIIRTAYCVQKKHALWILYKLAVSCGSLSATLHRATHTTPPSPSTTEAKSTTIPLAQNHTHQAVNLAPQGTTRCNTRSGAQISNCGKCHMNT